MMYSIVKLFQIIIDHRHVRSEMVSRKGMIGLTRRDSSPFMLPSLQTSSDNVMVAAPGYQHLFLCWISRRVTSWDSGDVMAFNISHATWSTCSHRILTWFWSRGDETKETKGAKSSSYCIYIIQVLNPDSSWPLLHHMSSWRSSLRESSILCFKYRISMDFMGWLYTAGCNQICFMIFW